MYIEIKEETLISLIFNVEKNLYRDFIEKKENKGKTMDEYLKKRFSEIHPEMSDKTVSNFLGKPPYPIDFFTLAEDQIDDYCKPISFY